MTTPDPQVLEIAEARIQRAIRTSTRADLEAKVQATSAAVKETRKAKEEVIASLTNNETKSWILSVLDNRLNHLMTDGRLLADVHFSLPTPKETNDDER
jgi:hypothetical protein